MRRCLVAVVLGCALLAQPAQAADPAPTCQETDGIAGCTPACTAGSQPACTLLGVLYSRRAGCAAGVKASCALPGGRDPGAAPTDLPTAKRLLETGVQGAGAARLRRPRLALRDARQAAAGVRHVSIGLHRG